MKFLDRNVCDACMKQFKSYHIDICHFFFLEDYDLCEKCYRQIQDALEDMTSEERTLYRGQLQRGRGKNEKLKAVLLAPVMYQFDETFEKVAE